MCEYRRAQGRFLQIGAWGGSFATQHFEEPKVWSSSAVGAVTTEAKRSGEAAQTPPHGAVRAAPPQQLGPRRREGQRQAKHRELPDPGVRAATPKAPPVR